MGVVSLRRLEDYALSKASGRANRPDVITHCNPSDGSHDIYVTDIDGESYEYVPE